MQLQQRINAFKNLGHYLGELASENHPDFEQLTLAKAHNRWFTIPYIQFALLQWEAALSEENLTKWCHSYSFPEKEPKAVAVVMAGNIPLVGFHDFISVLISGNSVLAKGSSNDKILLPFIAKKLVEIEPSFLDRITFSEGKLESFDAVIATGSNNTSLHFEYYFGKYPHIIRKNRNSVAVLTGNETPQQLELLAEDIFSYFGLGCRNVSKLYLPEGYHFDAFFNAMFSQKEVINHDKYMNNYDYNKAVYLMSNIPLLDNEFLLLKEDAGFSSPIAVVFYEYYQSLERVKKHLGENAEHLQCIVSALGMKNEVAFGQTQSPALWEYADGVDTMEFLLNLA
ncbi:MAG: acyl-CoA reductase [Flavobacteriaceae bacterium]